VGFAQRIGIADASAGAALRHWPASAWRQNHLANVAPFGKEAMGVTGPAEGKDFGNNGCQLSGFQIAQ
jgi:hypothetical protein